MNHQTVISFILFGLFVLALPLGARAATHPVSATPEDATDIQVIDKNNRQPLNAVSTPSNCSSGP